MTTSPRFHIMCSVVQSTPFATLAAALYPGCPQHQITELCELIGAPTAVQGATETETWIAHIMHLVYCILEGSSDARKLVSLLDTASKLSLVAAIARASGCAEDISLGVDNLTQDEFRIFLRDGLNQLSTRPDRKQFAEDRLDRLDGVNRLPEGKIEMGPRDDNWVLFPEITSMLSNQELRAFVARSAQNASGAAVVNELLDQINRVRDSFFEVIDALVEDRNETGKISEISIITSGEYLREFPQPMLRWGLPKVANQLRGFGLDTEQIQLLLSYATPENTIVAPITIQAFRTTGNTSRDSTLVVPSVPALKRRNRGRKAVAPKRD